MSVLEKILEEIKVKTFLVATSKEHYIHPQDGRFVEEVVSIEDIGTIICSHMNELPDTNAGKWIRVSQKSPEEKQEVWISTQSEVKHGIYTKRYGFGCKEAVLCNDGATYMDKMTAWMPFHAPELYKGEENEEINR